VRPTRVVKHRHVSAVAPPVPPFHRPAQLTSQSCEMVTLLAGIEEGLIGSCMYRTSKVMTEGS
jgi:hypothetical protein